MTATLRHPCIAGPRLIWWRRFWPVLAIVLASAALWAGIAYLIYLMFG